MMMMMMMIMIMLLTDDSVMIMSSCSHDCVVLMIRSDERYFPYEEVTGGPRLHSRLRTDPWVVDRSASRSCFTRLQWWLRPRQRSLEAYRNYGIETAVHSTVAREVFRFDMQKRVSFVGIHPALICPALMANWIVQFSLLIPKVNRDRIIKQRNANWGNAEGDPEGTTVPLI